MGLPRLNVDRTDTGIYDEELCSLLTLGYQNALEYNILQALNNTEFPSCGGAESDNNATPVRRFHRLGHTQGAKQVHLYLVLIPGHR